MACMTTSYAFEIEPAGNIGGHGSATLSGSRGKHFGGKRVKISFLGPKTVCQTQQHANKQFPV